MHFENIYVSDNTEGFFNRYIKTKARYMLENSTLVSLLQKAIPLIENTATFIAGEYGQVTSDKIEVKDKNSLVSYVDKQAERMLVKGLQEIFPLASFVTEEKTIEQEEKEYQWIIDPLDGTTNFLYDIPHFSISVALKYHDQILIGVVYDVMRKECFAATLGGGASLNGQPIQIRKNTDLAHSIVATGFPYKGRKDTAGFFEIFSYFMSHSRGIRRMGSAALDLAYVAAGRLDGYYECCLNPWDVAAGILLVQEAGGVVSDFHHGEKYHTGKEIIASNAHLLPDFLFAVQSFKFAPVKLESI